MMMPLFLPGEVRIARTTDCTMETVFVRGAAK